MGKIIIGERLPGRLNDYIDEALPHYEAVAKSERSPTGIQFQARYEADRIIVYGSPQTDFDDAIAMLEMTLDSLRTDPAYSGMIPALREDS